MGGRWPYSYCFVGGCFQDLFNIAHSILVSFPSSFFSMCLVSAHAVHPYSNMDTTTAWKKMRFILSDRSNFHMTDSLSIAVHAFVSRVLMSFSLDDTLLSRYVNLSTWEVFLSNLYILAQARIELKTSSEPNKLPRCIFVSFSLSCLEGHSNCIFFFRLKYNGYFYLISASHMINCINKRHSFFSRGKVDDKFYYKKAHFDRLSDKSIFTCFLWWLKKWNICPKVDPQLFPRL